MSGALLRRREPAVVVLLLVVLVREALAVGFAVAALLGTAGPYGLAAYAAAGEAGEPVALALLAALVVSCHASPMTTRARTLTGWSLGAVALAVLLGLVVVVLGLTGADSSGLAVLPSPLGPLNVVERLLALVVPVLALLTLLTLLRRPAPATAPDGDEQPALTAGAPAAGDPPAREADPALQPTWRPDAATGAVWLSAGDAASGRPPTTAAPVGDADEPHPWASGPR